MLKAIVFDFDGVIADSEPLHLRAYQTILERDGIELTREEYYARYLGFDDSGAFERVARFKGIKRKNRHLAPRAEKRLSRRARRAGGSRSRRPLVLSAP